MQPFGLLGANGSANFQVLWEDGERIFCRGASNGDRSAVLVVLPAGENPTPATLNRLAHEYGLKDELDGAWAVRPLELISENGRSMLVLEDPGGEPLGRLLGAPMEVERFLRLAIGIAVALGKLHQRGLVHKDIKPVNILVNGATGAVKFTGFGIASRLLRERQAPEPPEMIAGTLAYMAPEQTGRMNRSVDSRSDLYALGVTFYELLTGALPFTAADPIELIHCHIAREPVPPGELASTVPAPLSMIVMKLLAKTAEERYQTAAGVEADLRKCLTAWESFGRIDPFLPGLQDASERLMIPEKLYGREGEIATLLAAFDRVVMYGGSELVLVSGYSGIGKSSVVNELHKVIVLPRGIFISGKFDLRLRDTPHSTLAQAFQGLIQQLLNGQADDIARWREAIKEAVGNQGRLLTDLIPNLVRLIGPQPTVAVLSPVDAQLRFQTVFQRFVGVFARAEHPLVIFVDDLQWLDPATLAFIEQLATHPDIGHLLLIGAYRDNEVGPDHMLLRTVAAIRQAGTPVKEIALGPISLADVTQLVADTLRCPRTRALNLAGLIYRKTGGNPFFAVQFLTNLAEEALVRRDPKTHAWTWDLEGIDAKGFTDNLVDLMVGRLRRLPSSAQDALKLLACLGSNAEIATLELVLDAPKAEINESLRVAIQAGIIVSRGGHYRFLHDRVQEAAYALIPDAQRPALHFHAGQRLLAELTDDEIAERIFDIVNQLNLGVPACNDPDEKARIARLNLQAGLRAKATTAYASACSYFASGIATLGDQGWEQAYELAFKLLLERAECELLNANSAVSAELIELLLANARTKTDRTEGFRLRITLQLLHGDMTLAVRTALECLKMFDMTFPERPTAEDVREEYDDLQRRIGSRPIENLIDLPLMEDPEIRALSSILLPLGQSSYYVDRHLYGIFACRMVKLSIDFGHSACGIIGCGGLGIILGPTFGRFEDGERFARVAVAVTERHDFLAHRPAAYVLLQMATLWTRTIDDALACLDAADKTAAETGELVYACLSAQHRITNLLARGDRLDLIWPESIKSVTFVRKKRYAHIIDVLLAIQCYIAMLRGDTSNDNLICDEATLLRSGIPVVQCFYWILQLQLRYLMGDPVAALEAAENAKPSLWSARCHIQAGTFQFYHALALLAVIRSAPTSEPSTLRESLKESFAALQTLADTAPHIYAHKRDLAVAEFAGLEGRDLEAMRLYEQAVRSALEKGYIQEAALGAELAANFFASRGLERIAQSYRREARDYYRRWGALGKVAQFDRRHPEAAPKVPQPLLPTVETSFEHLDLVTVIRMSQAVAGEIVLEKLIETLMVIAVEHAGADRGLLILPHGGQYQIEAEARSGRDGVRVRLLETPVTPSELPLRILEKVIRTQSQVILDDARGQSMFEEDEYISRKRVRSLLCLPLLKQAELIGVLYLENSLASHVFTPARIAVLKLLALQAAIALDNARLYRDVAEREAKIRRLVDANIIGIFISSRTGEIIEANDAFLNMVGYDREDLAAGNMRWTDLTPPEWRTSTARALEGMDTTGAVQPYEKEYVRKDGGRVSVLIGSAAFDEQRDQGVAFVLDLTERKRAEEAFRKVQMQLAHANRVVTMGQLTSSIAHEVNQPITAAVTYALAARRWLSAEPPNFSEVDDALSLVVKEGNRAGEVVGRIRALIKKAPPRKDAVSINDAILEVVALTRTEAAKNGVLVRTQLAEGLPPVQGDRVLLQQILLNLIINAIEAMRDVGEEERELLISSRNEPDGVSVEVRDSGPGFAPEDLERVFEAFHTTKPGGLGLGLSICRSIIEAHNGRLWASPNVPRGAIFRFIAPAHPAAAS